MCCFCRGAVVVRTGGGVPPYWPRVALGKMETSGQVEDIDRGMRKKTHIEYVCIYRTLTHATHPKQIMKAAEKRPTAKSTTLKEKTTEQDANKSKYHLMPTAGISPKSPSYMMLAQDFRDLGEEILHKKWPKEVVGVQDHKEGIKIKDIKVIVLLSPTQIMCVPAGTMIDPKIVGYMYLAFLSVGVQTA